MASQTKVLKICHYSLDSTYLLLNSTVHNGTSHNYKHLRLALKHKSMAESINLLYLDEQTLQKGEIKKLEFLDKEGDNYITIDTKFKNHHVYGLFKITCSYTSLWLNFHTKSLTSRA